MSQLPTWVSIAQIAASTLLAVCALVVAIISARLTYRNNFGWTPGLIVLEGGLGTALAYPRHRSVSLLVQVWNRQRYPISVIHCQMKLSDLRIDTELPIETSPRPSADSYYLHVSDEVHFDLDNVLQPNTSLTTSIRFHYIADPPFDPPGSFEFTFRYYDPRAHKVLDIKEKQTFRLSLKLPAL